MIWGYHHFRKINNFIKMGIAQNDENLPFLQIGVEEPEVKLVQKLVLNLENGGVTFNCYSLDHSPISYANSTQERMVK